MCRTHQNKRCNPSSFLSQKLEDAFPDVPLMPKSSEEYEEAVKQLEVEASDPLLYDAFAFIGGKLFWVGGSAGGLIMLMSVTVGLLCASLCLCADYQSTLRLQLYFGRLVACIFTV